MTQDEYDYIMEQRAVDTSLITKDMLKLASENGFRESKVKGSAYYYKLITTYITKKDVCYDMEGQGSASVGDDLLLRRDDRIRINYCLDGEYGGCFKVADDFKLVHEN